MIYFGRMFRKGLTDQELEILLLEISNEQAENTDIGGDSDAEDDVLFMGRFYFW